MRVLQFIPNQELVANYLRQEYYRTKFVLFFLNLNRVSQHDCSTLFALEKYLELNKGDLTERASLPLVILEVESLDCLKNITRNLHSANLKTVNNEQEDEVQIEFLSFAFGVEIGSNLYLDENIRLEFLAAGKSPVYIEIQRTATKIPVLGVGGGSMSNLLGCRYVLSAKKHLKRAVFVRHSGDLVNSKNQALVPILEGDLIVDVNGTKPFDLRNKDLNIKLYRVVAIHETKLECEDITKERLDGSHIPKRVVEGAHTYHNRDGSFFCSEVKSKKEVAVKS